MKPDIWDAIQDLNERTIEILERVSGIEARLSDGIPEALKDHEKRIRRIERGMWLAIGALALLEFAMPLAFKIWGGW